MHRAISSLGVFLMSESTVSSGSSRRRRLAIAALAGASVLVLGTGTAFAAAPRHGEEGKKSDGHSHKEKSKKHKKTKHQTGHGTTISAGLTGDSPCELSGPPASAGQTGKDAEGHDARGPMHQAPVTKADREKLIAEQVIARDVAVRFPTVAAAEAAGYKKSTVYVPCIGAHYTNMALIVGAFDPATPSELLFDGGTPDAKIVGLSYLLFNKPGAPEGFSGPNDVWHQHNANGGLCLNREVVVVGNESTTPEECKKRGGRKVKLDDIWMVHNWVVPGWECGWGVFAGECPELGGRLGGTVFDKPDPAAFKKAMASGKVAKKKKKSHGHESGSNE